MADSLIKGVDHTGVSVVYLCHDGKGNILMHRRGENARDEQGHWDWGGGGLEFDDTVEDTLRKEIKEEYGADVLDREFICFRDVHREHDGKRTHWIALYFKVLVDRNAVRNGEPHKFDEIGWFRLNDLPSPLHSHIPSFLEEYRDVLDVGFRA
jgi:8-oxo-dGTP diphosphatase